MWYIDFCLHRLDKKSIFLYLSSLLKRSRFLYFKFLYIFSWSEIKVISQVMCPVLVMFWAVCLNFLIWRLYFLSSKKFTLNNYFHKPESLYFNARIEFSRFHQFYWPNNRASFQPKILSISSPITGRTAHIIYPANI